MSRAEPGRDADAPVLSLEHLEVRFPVRGSALRGHRQWVHAVSDVTLDVHEGETLGIVGESGCGKTTLIRTIVRLVDSTSGRIRYRGTDITRARRRALSQMRRELQMVFQDPQSSLNPRKRVGQILATPLRLRGVARRDVSARAREMLADVGLNPEHLNRFPHEFSGGQRQRIGIARALAMRPGVLLLDEPVSALDVSVQAQVINLLADLRERHRLTLVFVAHDLSVVRHVSDRVAVMYLGKLVELAPAADLYARPRHPYTSALLAAIPIPDPRENRSRERHVAPGEPPNPIDPPSGCRFHPRCPRATDICRTAEPQLTEYESGHLAACHHPTNVTAQQLAAAVRSSASPLSASPQVPDLLGDDAGTAEPASDAPTALQAPARPGPVAPGQAPDESATSDAPPEESPAPEGADERPAPDASTGEAERPAAPDAPTEGADVSEAGPSSSSISTPTSTSTARRRQGR